MSQSDQINLLLRQMQAHPVAKSAAQRVYEDLRHRIIHLDLKPGTPLSRNDLAKEYAVSLTPIREAMQMLEQDGLLKIFPQSRTLVAQIDLQQLWEDHFLRIALETEAVRRLAEDPPKEILERTRALLELQRAIMYDPEKLTQFDDLDRTLHKTFFEGVNMIGVHELLVRRQGQLHRCQRLELPSDGKMEVIIAQHEAVLTAIENRDVQGAIASIRAHLSGTIQRITKLQDNHPEYFAG